MGKVVQILIHVDDDDAKEVAEKMSDAIMGLKVVVESAHGAAIFIKDEDDELA